MPSIIEIEKSKNVPTSEKRHILEMFYSALLTGLDRKGDIEIFKKAIYRIPEREIEQEWSAILDGTVSKIVDTLVKRDLDPEDLDELASLYEGLAVPYFKDYEGDVPEEDLDWAHKQVKEYFDKVSRKKEERQKLLSDEEPKKLESRLNELKILAKLGIQVYKNKVSGKLYIKKSDLSE